MCNNCSKQFSITIVTYIICVEGYSVNRNRLPTNSAIQFLCKQKSYGIKSSYLKAIIKTHSSNCEPNVHNKYPSNKNTTATTVSILHTHTKKNDCTVSQFTDTDYIFYAIRTFILTVYGIRSSCDFQINACITVNRNNMHSHQEL